MEPLAVDVREAARLVSLSPFTVRRYIKRGLLEAIRIGRRVLVPMAECERIAREGVPPRQAMIRESELAKVIQDGGKSRVPRKPAAERSETP